MLCSVKSPYMDRNDASDPRRPTPIRRQVEETFGHSDEGAIKGHDKNHRRLRSKLCTEHSDIVSYSYISGECRRASSFVHYTPI